MRPMRASKPRWSRTFADGRSGGLAWRCPLDATRCSRLGGWRAGPRSWASASTSLRYRLVRLTWQRLQAPGILLSPLPRTRLVAGAQEPFFLENARRWADALRDAAANAVMNERAGSHDGAFWREEFPLIVAWAFGR